MLLFYYGLHHNPAVWEKPEIFSPERFLPDPTTARSQFAWIPFSAGPRKCIGDEFAMMEAILTVARVLQRYQLHVTTTNVEPYIGATLRISKPIVGTVTKRL
jgi:cytochrome P450